MDNKTAILFIDPYNEFLHPDGKIYPRLKDGLAKSNAIEHMRLVLKAARANDLPTFYCMHQQTHDSTFKDWTVMNANHTRARDNQVFREGSFGVEYFAGMEPDIAAGDVVVSKHWNSSSFANTDLEFQLKQKGIRHVILAGMVANTCLESTARYAYELAYEITILTDATAGFSDEARVMAAKTIWPYFANRVLTTDEWVKTLESRAQM